MLDSGSIVANLVLDDPTRVVQVWEGLSLVHLVVLQSSVLTTLKQSQSCCISYQAIYANLILGNLNFRDFNAGNVYSQF